MKRIIFIFFVAASLSSCAHAPTPHILFSQCMAEREYSEWQCMDIAQSGKWPPPSTAEMEDK